MFTLDEALRQDVPGTDGWYDGQDLFDQEMASPESDPTGYLVAQRVDTGELAGLIRFWRNDPTPALGLLAVLPEHRSGFLAYDLLHAGLTAASEWGSATCTGRFAQMVHRG